MIANKNKGAAASAAVKKKEPAERTSRQAAEPARKPVQTAGGGATTKATPTKAAPTKATPTKAAPTKATPTKAAPTKAVQASKTTAAKETVIKTENKTAETAAAKPAKASAPKAETAPTVPATAPAKVAAASPAPEAAAPAARTEAAAPATDTPVLPAGEAARAAQQKSAKKPVAKPAEEPAAKKSSNQRHGFKTQEFIVYPAHGVGQITAIEEQEVAGYKLELFVISFAKDKMTLRVPITKIASVGMRKLAEPALVKRALDTLKGRARIKRTMWSRRAQEYEAKINSGDIVSIAEVVRDLYRSESQPEQSYSERQLYEAALDRLAREIAAVERVTETEAVKLIEGALAKGPRRGAKTSETAEGEDDDFVADEAA